MALPSRLAFSPLALFASVLVTGGAVAAGCIVDWADDCARNRDYPGCQGKLATGLGGGTGAGGTGSSSSGSVDGGDAGGGPTGCTDAGSCPPVPAGPCAALGMATCTAGMCGVAYNAGPAPSQDYGNCFENLCDQNGVMTSMVSTTNVENNGNACASYTCNPVGASVPAAEQNMTCTLGGTIMGYCEPDPYSAVLTCAECNAMTGAGCSGVPGTGCSTSGSCLLQHCFNMKLDGPDAGAETDVDCGGPDCLPCAVGKNCGTANDCISRICNGTPRVCQPSSCSDNVKNGTETDVDCGGSDATCMRCAAGNMCLQSTDCQSGVCRPTLMGQLATCQAPSCTDGVQNGGETGVDCGGTPDGGHVCPPCADGGG